MTKRKDEWVTIAQAAVIAGCSGQTIRNRSRDDRGSTKKEGRRRMVRRAWAESLVVGRSNSWGVAQIEGLKTRLKAVEKERDALVCAQGLKAGEIKALHDGWSVQAQHIKTLKAKLAAAEKERDEATAKLQGYQSAPAHVAADVLRSRLHKTEKERDNAFTARDKWAADHARQKKEIEALKAHPVSVQWSNAAMAARDKWLPNAPPPAVIDRLVAAVESAPLKTLMQIDQPRHAALRRVVGLWTAVQHAVESFTPGDIAQTTNDDDEVT